MVKKNNKELLVILDTHAILHRAYHALPMFSSKGEPTGALYGLASFLLRVIRELKPDYIAAATDLPDPTFRHAAYENYKGQRAELDSDLVRQITRSYDLLGAFGVPVYDAKGFEADDIIGTLVKKTSKAKRLNVIIASGDLDTLQLIEGKRVRVYTLKGGLNDTILYDEKKVKERFGFLPKLLTDYKGLRGDASDNIKGVPGIGEKTASELIQKFGKVEDIYKSLKKNREAMLKAGVKERMLEILKEHEEDARFSKTLAEIRSDAPIEFALEGTRFAGHFKKEKAEEAMKEFGFVSLISRLPEEERGAGDPEEGSAVVATDRSAFLGAKDIWWAQDPEGGITYAVLEGGQVCTFLEGEREEAALLLQKKVRHHFFNAKLLFHRLGLSHSLPAILSDVKIAAWISRPEAEAPDLVEVARSFLPEERLGQTAFIKALSLLPRLEAEIQKEIHEKKLERVLNEIELPLIPVLFEMEKQGILIDGGHLKKLSKDFTKRLALLEENIWKLAGTSFNVSSPKQLGEVLFGKLNLTAPGLKKTATGARSTRESELLKLKNLHPIVPEILAFRELSKLKSTYIDAFPRLADREGRVHTTYDQTGAVTGRLSSSEPNLQNIPIRSEFGRSVRSAFIATPNCTLVSFDYSQIELRVAAILSGDKKMQRAFQEGRDIHIETASEIFNVPAEQVTDEMRRRAKTINFGVLYGMGASALSQSLEISRGEAEKFLGEYFRDFSGVRRYLQKTREEAAKNGFVETAYGRRRYLPEIRSQAEYIRSEAERMAINAPIQGTAADIVKLAMIRAEEFIEKKCVPGEVRLLLQIHDELLFEVKEGAIKKCLPPLRKILESVFKSGVPLTVEVKMGQNWASMQKIKL